MSQYFETTKYLISLEPTIAIPAHGPPNFEPVKLLKDYLQHRQKRFVFF